MSAHDFVLENARREIEAIEQAMQPAALADLSAEIRALVDRLAVVAA